jgi:hypothetical protein
VQYIKMLKFVFSFSSCSSAIFEAIETEAFLSDTNPKLLSWDIL